MTANLLGYGFFLVLQPRRRENLGVVVALTNLAVIRGRPPWRSRLVVARRVARAGSRDQSSAGGHGLRTGDGGPGDGTAHGAAALITLGTASRRCEVALLLALVVGPTCLTYAVLGDLGHRSFPGRSPPST